MPVTIPVRLAKPARSEFAPSVGRLGRPPAGQSTGREIASLLSLCFAVVRPRRLELPRAFAHNDLNVARLPVPPRPHVNQPPDRPTAGRRAPLATRIPRGTAPLCWK